MLLLLVVCYRRNTFRIYYIIIAHCWLEYLE